MERGMRGFKSLRGWRRLRGIRGVSKNDPSVSPLVKGRIKNPLITKEGYGEVEIDFS